MLSLVIFILTVLAIVGYYWLIDTLIQNEIDLLNKEDLFND